MDYMIPFSCVGSGELMMMRDDGAQKNKDGFGVQLVTYISTR